MNANTRNKLLPAAFATSDKDEKIPEPTVVPTPSAITAQVQVYDQVRFCFQT